VHSRNISAVFRVQCPKAHSEQSCTMPEGICKRFGRPGFFQRLRRPFGGSAAWMNKDAH
jgi:hypothetical protein